MRYLPLTDKDRIEMFETIGIKDIDDLFSNIQKKVDINPDLKLPNHMTEIEVEKNLSGLAGKNLHANNSAFFLGGGSYNHHIPSSVDHIIQRSEFLTSYTPYQPEISQGTLQYLYEFQTQVSLLTGMDVSNASMYDGSTSTAEAVSMAKRITKKNRVVLSSSIHPHYAQTIKTVSGISDEDLSYKGDILENLMDIESQIDEDTACVVVQNPDFFGSCHDLSYLSELIHKKGALLIVVVTEIFSLGVMKSPGDMGADIVACEGQSLGNSLNFGGPYVGLLSTRKKYLRQLPGRIVGESEDVDGRKGFVLTLSAREQHIRREKATSNICTNSGLCSLAFTIHLTLLGELGFKKLSLLNHEFTCDFHDMISRLPGFEVVSKSFYNEFTLKLPINADDFLDSMSKKGILAGIPIKRLLPQNKNFDNYIIVACTEMNSKDDFDLYVNSAKEITS